MSTDFRELSAPPPLVDRASPESTASDLRAVVCEWERGRRIRASRGEGKM